MTPAIEVVGLQKHFDGSAAVAGISFAVRAGEIFGLLGPNGAGKTTTLRVIATVLEPSAGDVRVLGTSVRQGPERVRAQLGVLSERTGLYDRLTAEENFHYFARLRDMSRERIHQCMTEIFPKLGISAYAQKRASQLSKGMKQKVALAIALAHDPPVMIFDEPTAGLDVMAARQVKQFIKERRRADKAILFSTHIMSEAQELCDRIAIIHKGAITASGTFAELRTRSGESELEEIFVKLVEEEEAGTA